MEKKSKLSEYKAAIITAIIVIVVGIIALVLILVLNNKSSIKELETDKYKVVYDKTWKIKQKEDSKIVLGHSDGGKIEINIVPVEEDYVYYSINELIDEISYNIETQNEDYKLILKRETSVGIDEYLGYEMLFENGDEQVLVTSYKKGDKLAVITYEANNDLFDILLDSVQNIIYNFEIKDEKIDLNAELNIPNDEIIFDTDEEFDQLLGERREYEIADSNVHATFEIPSIFEIEDFDSQNSWFEYDDPDDVYKNIKLRAYIYPRNIYEVIDKDNDDLLAAFQKNFYLKNMENISNIEEKLTKIERDGFNAYLYRITYDYTTEDYFTEEKIVKKSQKVDIIYESGVNSVVEFEIETSDHPITQKLIDEILLKTISNYASYINIEKDSDNKIIGRLREFVDYKKEQYFDITLKIDDSFSEYDPGYINLYEERMYTKGYDQERHLYEYKIDIQRTEFKDSFLKNINYYYGSSNVIEHEELKYVGNKTINGKEFEVYNGYCIKKGGVTSVLVDNYQYRMNETILIYKYYEDDNFISDNKYLVFDIQGNDQEITDEVLQQVVNFDIKIVDI